MKGRAHSTTPEPYRNSGRQDDMRLRRGTMPDTSRTKFPQIANSKANDAKRSEGENDECTFLSHLPMILLNIATISMEQSSEKRKSIASLDDLKKGMQFEQRALDLAEETLDDKLIMKVLLHNVKTKIQMCMHEELSKEESSEMAKDAARHFYR